MIEIHGSSRFSTHIDEVQVVKVFYVPPTTHHLHNDQIILLTTLVVPDCMSGKKAGLTCGATGRGGATIGNPTMEEINDELQNINTKNTNFFCRQRKVQNLNFNGLKIESEIMDFK